ncbi:MAG TPA: winged helix-turn-helix domain-containing protein [Propionicimonas sp.]|nr:winged helix-turn-helix domain-containing protein [Propionicimonas sp.]
MGTPGETTPDPLAAVEARRRPATDAEAAALANVVRQRIVRLTGVEELTNRQLADRLGVDPATSHYHLRILLDAGLVEQLPTRAGRRGAREKPYRSTGRTWWLSDPLAGAPAGIRFGPVALAVEDALAAGPEAVSTASTFFLHLSETEVDEFAGRLLEVIDRYIATDSQRADAGHPVRRGIVLLHRPAGTAAPASPDTAPSAPATRVPGSPRRSRLPG